jgi:hypothetical protein
MTLQFDTAATNCAVCKQPISADYYTAGKSIVCANCKARIETAKAPAPASPVVVARAALFGLGGALLGAALYYAVLAILHLMISIIAIAVAYLVGRAVHMGSGGRRGVAFQIIAVALTYCGIALGYAFMNPSVLAALSIPAAIVYVVALPVRIVLFNLPGSLLTGLIIAIGLWQAWLMNRASTRPSFAGPFRVGARA